MLACKDCSCIADDHGAGVTPVTGTEELVQGEAAEEAAVVAGSADAGQAEALATTGTVGLGGPDRKPKQRPKPLLEDSELQDLPPEVLPQPADIDIPSVRPAVPLEMQSTSSPTSSKPSFGLGVPPRPSMWPGLPAGSVNGETPALNFVAVLSRRDYDTAFGVWFHTSDRRCFEILDVDDTGETAATEHNSRVDPAHKLLPGRFIMSVNDDCDIAVMEAEWDKGTHVKLQVCQAMEFVMRLEKEKGSTLGIDVHIDRRAGSIIILRLGEGLLAGWNSKRPELEVKVLDRIVAVNGNRTRSDKLLQALKDATGDTKVVIARPSWRGAQRNIVL